MRVELELWQLILLLIAFFGCVGGFAKLLGGQIDRRLDEKFKAQEEAREAGASALRDSIERYVSSSEKTAGKLETLERDFLKWQAELPIHYVRREDYVRGQSVIEAKLDALYSKLEVVQMKGAKNG